MSTSLDYVEKTPSWALYGGKEGGFDPSDSRHMRKKKKDINGILPKIRKKNVFLIYF